MKPIKTAADYAAIAVAPVLIFLMISSLANFFTLTLYRGGFTGRISWILLMFTMGTVGIARIAIERDRAYSLGYAGVLGLATFVTMIRFVDSPIFAILILGLIAYLSDVIVRDCTLIDDEVDASGEGLIDSGRLFVKDQIENQKNAEASASAKEVPSDSDEKKSASASKRKKSGKAHQPGRTVLYLALAALPLFGLGQFFLRNDTATWDRAQRLLAFYLFASLSLLVTTSFLGLRRYLRQRKVDMPADVSIAWLGGGVAMIATVLVIAYMAPMPGRALATFNLPYQLDSPGDTQASRFGWGSEGADQSNPDAPKTIDPQQGKQEEGQVAQKGAPQGNVSEGGRDKGPAGNQSGGKQSGGSPSKKSAQSQDQSSQSKSKSSQSSSSKSGQSKPEQSQSKSEQAQSKQAQAKNSSSGQEKSQSQQSKSKQSQSQPSGAKPESSQQQQSGSKDSDSQKETGDKNSGNENSGDEQSKSDQSGESDSEAAEQESESNQKESDQDGSQQAAESEKESNPQSESSQQGSQKSNSDAQNESSSGSAGQAIAKSIGFVASLIKFLVFIALAGIVAAFVWMHRDMIRQWWESLMGMQSVGEAPPQDELLELITKVPPKQFASFRNPIGKEKDSRRAMVITFQAFEAWSREQGTARERDETPTEFLKRVTKAAPQVSKPAAQVVDSYNRIVYGRGRPSERDMKAAAEVWQRMQQTAAIERPAPTEA